MEINMSSDNVRSLTKPFHCTRCSKSFALAKSLEEHILNKHVEDKEFQCKKCLQDKKLSKFFATQDILNQHKKRVHGPPRFKCQVCFKTFNDSSNLSIHKRTHSAQPQPILKRHKCDICSKGFGFNYELQTHLFVVHKQKREDVTYFQCEFCRQEFAAKCRLEIHVVREHVVDKAFKCSVCSKKFIDQATLEKHMKRHDRQLTYFCDVCSKGFIQKRNLNKHLGVQHNKFFYCEKCCRSFQNKPDFDKHIFISAVELKCYICQQLFPSECNLILHTNSHAKEIKPEKNEEVKIVNEMKPEQSGNSLNAESASKIECELCSKIFDREAYFTAHRNQVHPNVEWKCNFSQCTKSFKWYNQLKKHKMIHEETKPFKCPAVNCGKSWASSGQLNEHFVSNELKSSLKCKICHDKFMALKYLDQLKDPQLKVHTATKKSQARGSPSRISKHSDAVVFICSSNSCSFESVRKAEVVLHYNQQHQLLSKALNLQKSSSSLKLSEKMKRAPEIDEMIERRFKCGICSKVFKYACKLTQHLQTHSSENHAFKCSLCSKTFKLQKYLKQHVERMHCQI